MTNLKKITSISLISVTDKRNPYYIPVIQNAGDRDEGVACGDSFFQRGGMVKSNITFSVSTRHTVKDAVINITDEPILKKVLSKLTDLYEVNKEDSSVFMCYTRASYIYLIRIIRLYSRPMGRAVLELALHLNSTKKYNIYKALHNANVFTQFRYRKLSMARGCATVLIPNYGIANYLLSSTHHPFTTDGTNFRNSQLALVFKRNINLKSDHLKILLDLSLLRDTNPFYYINNGILSLREMNETTLQQQYNLIVRRSKQRGTDRNNAVLSTEEINSLFKLKQKLMGLELRHNNPNFNYEEFYKIQNQMQAILEKHSITKLTDLDALIAKKNNS